MTGVEWGGMILFPDLRVSSTHLRSQILKTLKAKTPHLMK